MLGALGDRTVEERGRKRAKVGLGDAVRLGTKRGIAHRPAAERIDLGGEVAVAANGLREVDGADHEVRRRADTRHRSTQPSARARRATVRNVRRRRDALEERARPIVNRRRIGAEALVKLEGGGGVDALKVVPTQ